MMTRISSPAKHFFIGLALVALGATASMAQGVVNNGAKINIVANTFFIIDNGGFDNRVNGAVTNAGTMDVDGDWLNAEPNGVFGLTPTTGKVQFDGATQDIGGAEETVFYDMTIKGTDRKTLTLSGTTPLSNGAKVIHDLLLDGQSLELNARTLTVENSLPGAISGSGKLISETGPDPTGTVHGYGVVKWNIPGTGNYTVPFGTVTEENISFGYNVTQVGVSGDPYKTFATYATDDKNSFSGGSPTGPYTPYPNAGTPWSNLPYSVTHLTDDYIQASHYWVVDRFWIIDEGNLGNGDNPAIPAGSGYGIINANKPKVDYTFRYAPSEIGGSNHIDPSRFVPQRFNHTGDTWGDWFYGVPSVTNPFPHDELTIHIAQDHPTNPIGDPDTWLEDMYPVWTLVDNSDPLPIELVRFAGECGDGSIELKWTTWTETNNDFFTVERSNNGTDFEIVDVIEGAGNSNQSITYNAIDNLPYGGTSYYRLKNTDFTGKSEYSEIIAVTCGTDGNDFNFVNAYDVDQTDIVVEFTAADNERFTIFLYDAAGRRALDFSGEAVDGMNKVRLPSGNLARGIYIINLSNAQRNFSKRVMLH